MKLYRYKITAWPERVDMEAWAKHAEELWGDPDKEFFLPRENRVFLTREAAQKRVDTARRWGGDGVVLAAEPEWEDVETFNAKQKLAQLRSEAEDLEWKLKFAELRRQTERENAAYRGQLCVEGDDIGGGDSA